MEILVLDIVFIFAFLLHCGTGAVDTIPIRVEIYQDVTLTCSVDKENIRNITVSWSKLLSDGNHKIMTIGSTSIAPFVTVLKLEGNDWNLKMENLSEANSGIYVCTSKINSVSTEIRRYNISIIPNRNNRKDDKPGTVVIETKSGKSIDMKCKVSGYDPKIGKVAWYKAPIGSKIADGEVITANTTYYTVLRENDVWILKVSIVNKTSGGLYICKYGDSMVANYEVKVEDVPLLKPMYHDTKTLPCLLPDNITEGWRVAWKHNGDPIRWDKYVVSLNGGVKVSKLNITRVTPSDSDGVYVCAFNNQPIQNCKFEVEVQRKPFVDTQLTTEKTVSFEEKETANLTCVMLGRPKPETEWYRRRKLPDAPWEATGVKGSILLIPDIERYAADEYICQGKNIHGEEKWNISVIVNFGPEIDVMESEITLTREENVDISCLVKCSEKPHMAWYDGNNRLVNQNYAFNPKTPSYLDGYSAYVMTLTFHIKDNGVEIFKGTYACQATLNGATVSKEITVKVPKKKTKDVDVGPYPPGRDGI